MQTATRIAYVPIASDFIEGQGYLVGIAEEGIPGYTPTNWRWAANGDFRLAQECADSKNASLGLTKQEAEDVISSTMQKPVIATAYCDNCGRAVNRKTAKVWNGMLLGPDCYAALA